MQFTQKEVIRMFHDFDDGNGCFKLLDGEFEIAHGSEFIGLVEVNVGQKIKALVGVCFMRLLVFAHGLKFVKDGDPVSLL